MKRGLILVAVAVLMFSAVLFQHLHRTGTAKNRRSPVELKNPEAPLFETKECHFADNVDLWEAPWTATGGTHLGYSSAAIAGDPQPADVEKFQPRQTTRFDPPITLKDRQLGYTLLELGSFKLDLHLKPGYPTPEALVPTRVDPAISGSFSF